MKKQDLEAYNKMVHEKYKYYKVWKWLAIIFIAISVCLIILFIVNGGVYKSETNINNNDVYVVNDGEGNTNNVGVYN